VTPKQGLEFVERHGIVLQAARGPVPSLAEAVAGGPIRGSWWGHPKGHEIFGVAEAVSESPDVLVCKLVDDKVTFVHRRLWAALVKLADTFRRGRLDKIWEEHTKTGAHVSKRTPFPAWVPDDVIAEAARLSIPDAAAMLARWPALTTSGRAQRGFAARSERGAGTPERQRAGSPTRSSNLRRRSSRRAGSP
jgi:hypothetical protein